ncbi:translational activator of GCN4 [Massospora cicadina]|nr:translational activator of GCN4 [Massospora cicadina]
MEVDRLIDHHPLRRCQYLDRLREGAINLNGDEVAQLCHGLLAAYSRYHDYKSRHGVIMLWRELFRSHPEVMAGVGPELIQREASALLKPHKGRALYPTSEVHPPHVGHDFFKWLWGSGADPTSIEAVLKVAMKLVGSLGEPEEVPYGLINATRRESSEASSFIVNFSLKANDDPNDLSFLANLLQAAGEVCSKLARYKPLIEAYAAKVLGAKSPVPRHVTDTVGEVFAKCMTEERYLALVKPAADKMLLRAPELVLPTLGALLRWLPFELSGLLASQLTDQLLASYQSSAAKTRQDAFNVFSTLCDRSTNVDNLLKAVEKVAKALSTKVASWEHRSLVHRSAGALGRKHPCAEVSNTILKSILLALPKETHEQALSALCESFSTHLQASAALLEKGLNHDKAGFRRAYIRAAGQILGGAKTLHAAVVNACVPTLASIAERIQAAPTAAGSVALEGYIAVAALERVRLSGQYTALLERSNYYNLSVYSTVKASKQPTFLLNDRMLGKLSDEEGYWLLRALETIGSGFGDLNDGLRAAFCHILVAASAALPSYEAMLMVSRITTTCGAASSPAFGLSLIDSLKGWLQAKRGFQASRFRKLLQLLFSVPTPDAGCATQLALASFILAAHPSVRPTDGSFMWVTLVGQAQLDLAQVVEAHNQPLTDLLLSFLSRGPGDTWWDAALEGAKLLAFISPERAATTLMTMAMDFLQPSALTQDDIAVWRTPPGMLCHEVLKRGHPAVEDRNRKGADLERWEREIREQLAAKEGHRPKLSKEEQNLVDSQLAKEAAVRDNVQGHVVRLQNGILLARNLVTGLKLAGILYELPPACEGPLAHLLVRMFSVVRHPHAPSLLRDRGVKGWLDLATVCSPELKDVPTLAGVATLRSYDLAVPNEWQGEPLGELLSRLLFRLQMLTSRKPLDPAAFAYIFPLLDRILLTGGVGFSSSATVKVRDAGHDDDQPSLQIEQVTLALNVLGNHAPLCGNSAMPRQRMAGALLHVIKAQLELRPTALEYLLQLSDGLGRADAEALLVLIGGLLDESPFVRKACLQSLDFVDLAGCPQWVNLWALRFSPDPSERQLAAALWEDNALEVPDNFCSAICGLLTHPVDPIRTCAANSFHDAILIHPDALPRVLDALYQLYLKLAEPIVPEYDRFGLLISASLQRTDPFDQRISVGLALGGIIPLAQPPLLERFFDFMLTREALADAHAGVRKAMLQAALVAIQHHGQVHRGAILPILQRTLDQPDANSQAQDYIREGAVILYGTLARNLADGAERTAEIVAKLIQTLDTPSESVQFAVAGCLPPLIRAAPATAPARIRSLLDRCINGGTFAKRRGAAFGLAGVAKGMGLTALKASDIMAAIYAAAKSKRAEARQGAMFALETLCELLGRQFEPYVIQTLPYLLVGFSDPSDDVRRATLSTSRVIMSKLSGHGIKRTLPSLLEGLEDYHWRTKRGAIELLGSMAYCAPRQLAVSLPTIVPRLIKVLNDSHPMVKLAADTALSSFTDVIRNPEIRSLMPQIMLALSDPNANTHAALKALLDTNFLHYLDQPSLALLVPILQRGLRERSTEIKCKASQIVGNMASLTDPVDLAPYLPGLLPLLLEILVDPVPEARSTSARSLGVMVAKLGEIHFPDLIQSLVGMLRDNPSSVDRSGAAQGLSEILAGLDLSRLEGLLPEILANTKSPKAITREGFTTMLIYLPATFGLRFKPYLPRVLAPVLNGLADDSDYVRDASLRAGQILITNYSDQAVNLLLPELQRGLYEPSWRIRHASAQLMGDLLFNLMGITVKLDAELAEDDEQAPVAAAEGTRRALLEILGPERRDLVLAGLYLVRADAAPKVRQVASAIWKLIVSNTPRALKEILPAIMADILRFITSPIPDRQTMAASALADLVRRVGESGLQRILPILHVNLDASEFEGRQAAVVALAEMIGTLGKSGSTGFLDVTTQAVLKALGDPSPPVRATAARTFDLLHQHMGPAALEAILPPLLDDLRSGRGAHALEAVQELVAVRANVVLPAAIPSLLTLPISRFDAVALRALVLAGGAAVNPRLRVLLPPLLSSCGQPDPAADGAVRAALEALFAQVDSSGLEVSLGLLLERIQGDSDAERAEGCAALATLFRVAPTGVNLLPYAVDWIRLLVPLYRAPSDLVMRNAALAFTGLVGCLDRGDLDQLVIPLRQTVKTALKGLPPGHDLPGFCQPRAIAPFVSVYLQGLMFSSSDVRERSAAALGELVSRTGLEALKPFVTQITGPLIRIVGERYPAPVKVAILGTLHGLLGRAGGALRPFLPQLQRTFMKCLGDANSADVRARAEVGLPALVALLPRLDPLCTELVMGCRGAEAAEVRQGFLQALASVVGAWAVKLAPATKDALRALIVEVAPRLTGKLPYSPNPPLAREKSDAKSILSLI